MQKLQIIRPYIFAVTFCITIFTFATPTRAAVSPVSIALLAPVQFPPEDFMITGVRVSALYGKHRSVYGLDFGVLGNITDLNFVGLAVSGVFNKTSGMTTIIGLQLAGLANVNTDKTSVYGIQATLGANVNTAAASVSGLQIALLTNYAQFTNIYGAQVGLYNRAQDVYGLQIGLVNVASNLHGVQIGLANFNQKGMFAVSPILNIGF